MSIPSFYSAMCYLFLISVTVGLICITKKILLEFRNKTAIQNTTLERLTHLSYTVFRFKLLNDNPNDYVHRVMSFKYRHKYIKLLVFTQVMNLFWLEVKHQVEH